MAIKQGTSNGRIYHEPTLVNTRDGYELKCICATCDHFRGGECNMLKKHQADPFNSCAFWAQMR